MSVNYGGPNYSGPNYGGPEAAYGGGSEMPPRRASLEWINEAWRLFSAQAGTWIVSCFIAILLPLVIYFIFGAVMGVATVLSARSQFGTAAAAPPAGMIVFVVLFWAVYGLLYQPFISSGVYRMADKQVRGELIGIGDIFSGGATTLRMLGFQLVYGLLGLGLSLIFYIPALLMHFVSLSALSGVAPGLPTGAALLGLLSLYALLLLGYAAMSALFLPAHALVADGEGVFSAFSRSARAAMPQVLPILGVLVLFGLVYLVSAIPCGLGLLVTVPMFWLLSALAYRDLVGMPTQGQAIPVSRSAPGVWPPAPGTWPPAPGTTPGSGQPPVSGQ